MSRKVYTISVTGLVSTYAGATFDITAPDLDAAKAEAIVQFKELVEEKFGSCLIEEIKADYTEVAEYEH